MSQKYVGGQAVIEGVMMRYGNDIATAIRKDGKIKIKKDKLNSYTEKYRFLGFPFFRGIVSLIEMLYVGTKTLMWSAKESADEDDLEIKSWQVTLTVIVSLGFAIGLFVVLPYVLSYGIGLEEKTQPILFNIADGVIKVIILLLYVYLIGLMKDIRRVFEYHGAEHKAVNMFENKAKQSYMSSKRHTTVHKRCGTNFLFIVILTGVIILSVIPYLLELIIPGFFDLNVFIRFPILILSRILLLPVIAGLAYEWLRLLGKYPDSSFLVLVSKPGMWLQKLTTKEPSKDQLEVAFAALNAVVKGKKA